MLFAYARTKHLYVRLGSQGLSVVSPPDRFSDSGAVMRLMRPLLPEAFLLSPLISQQSSDTSRFPKQIAARIRLHRGGKHEARNDVGL